MRQLLQDLKTGHTDLADVPTPAVRDHHVLVSTRASIVSLGTERMLVEFGRASLLAKARQQPDKVRQVLDKIRTDGIATTVQAVRSKLDRPMPLGYSNVGTILEVGREVRGVSVGDRVISNGPHAEIVCVPANLTAVVPPSVPDADAAFTVLGAIGLQGIRLAKPTMGESIVVVGLGLVGQLVAQLLKANGCRVIGVDIDRRKTDLAANLGIDVTTSATGSDLEQLTRAHSRGRGADAVIITASTKSNQPIDDAARICRRKGRIILVGVTGLKISRSAFYAKELSFQVSCSYGPGRYDPEYENMGRDYPVDFVRWTSQRNFEAFLDALAAKRLAPDGLITHRLPFSRALDAYSLLNSPELVLGILLEYQAPQSQASPPVPILRGPPAEPIPWDSHRPLAVSPPRISPSPVLGVIGPGDHVMRTLLPSFKKQRVRFKTVVSQGGVSAAFAARKFGFVNASTDVDVIWNDPDINTVLIGTRHGDHASLVQQALLAGKHVYCEKPLAITHEQLLGVRSAIDKAVVQSGQVLMLGFNRRFSPHITRISQLLRGQTAPKAFIMTVNAGELPPDHWTHDPAAGGGRIVGEACHFIDLLRYLAAWPITASQVMQIGRNPAIGVRSDKLTINLAFADGSIGFIHYLANGHRQFPKERLDVFTSGRVLHLNNFKHLVSYGWPQLRSFKTRRQNKGHDGAVSTFCAAVGRGTPPPIPLGEILEVSEVTLDIAARTQHT